MAKKTKGIKWYQKQTGNTFWVSRSNKESVFTTVTGYKQLCKTCYMAPYALRMLALDQKLQKSVYTYALVTRDSTQNSECVIQYSQQPHFLNDDLCNERWQDRSLASEWSLFSLTTWESMFQAFLHNMVKCSRTVYFSISLTQSIIWSLEPLLSHYTECIATIEVQYTWYQNIWE